MSKYKSWPWSSFAVFEDIDARLSALEAAQKKPDAPTTEQREPGLYVVKLLNDLYGLRRWSQRGGWLTQSGYHTFESPSDYTWIGPRIPEPGE